MLLLDDDRRLRQANRAALQMLGLQLSALTRHRLDQLVARTSNEALDSEWRRMLAAGQGHGRLLVRRPDGGVVEFHYSATARIAGELHLLVLVPGADLREGITPGPALSDREREVLSRIANGEEGTELAGRLLIAPETVRRHLSNARQKLGARSRAHAVALALARGEIGWPTAGPEESEGD
jgi:DNA-binding CsgD family transcriptional regulator